MWLVLDPIKMWCSPDMESPKQQLGAQLLCRYLAVLQLGLQPAHSNAGGPVAVNDSILHRCGFTL